MGTSLKFGSWTYLVIHFSNYLLAYSSTNYHIRIKRPPPYFHFFQKGAIQVSRDAQRGGRWLSFCHKMSRKIQGGVGLNQKRNVTFRKI